MAISKALLCGMAAFVISASQADIVYEAGFLDSVDGWKPAANNVFKGLGESAIDRVRGPMKNGEDGAILADDDDGYFETQCSPAKLTDGAFPNMPGNDYGVHEYHLIENHAVLTFTLEEPANLKGFNFYTQWDDGGYRNDVSVSKIETSADGENWAMVSGSKFNYSQTESRNTIGTHVGNLAKRRYVKFYDNVGLAMAVGAKYVRITFGIQNVGYGAYWEIEAIGGGIVGTGVVSAAAEAAMMSATVGGAVVPDAGDGSMVVRFGRNPDALEREVTAAIAGDGSVLSYSATLSDLMPGTEYFYSVDYSEGGSVVSTKTGSFRTEPEPGLELPGLWQARLNGNLNTADGLAASDIGVARALGPIMGFTRVEDYATKIHNDVDGKDYAWADNKTYLYQGFIWLEAGETYNFWTCQDDDGRVAIDGAEVVRSSSCGSADADYTPTETGWHAIDIRVGNGGGWAGANDGGTGVGFTRPGGGRQRLADTGTGTFLCCTPDYSVPGSFKVVSSINADGQATVIMSADFTETVSVSVWCGETYGGKDPTAWTSTDTVIGSIQVGGSVQNIFSFTIPDGTKYLRFAAARPSDSKLLALTPTVPVADMAEPSAAATVDNLKIVSTTPASATFAFDVIDPGAASDWTVTAVYGFAADALDYEQSLGSGSGIRGFTGALDGLLPGHPYFVKLVVDNGVESFETKVMTLTTDLYAAPSAGSRAVVLGSAAVSAEGVLSGALTLAAGDADATVYVVYGDNEAGENVSAWDHQTQLGTAAAANTSFALDATLGTGVPGTSVKFVRFCAVTGGVSAWTAPIALGAADLPAFAGVTTVTGLQSGDTLVVASSLPFTPAGACTVTVEASRTGDFSDAVSYACGSVSAGGTVEKTLYSSDKTADEYIKPGETVHLRLKAVDAEGNVGFSGIETVTPYGAPVVGALSPSWQLWDVTVTGSLEAYGAGTGCTVELLMAKKGETPVKVDEQAVADGETFTLTTEVAEFGEYTYQVRVTSACSTETFDVASPAQTLNVVDNSYYYWKADIAEGDWSDPDNWERSKTSSSGRKSYPNSAECVVTFERRSEPTVVNVDGKFDVYMIGFGGQQAPTLTLAGKGEPGVDNLIHVFWGDSGLQFTPGTDFTLSNAYVRHEGKYFPQRDSKTRILFGSTFELNTEYWWHQDQNSRNTFLEIRGKSTLLLKNYSLRAQGGSGTVIVDDSTITVGENSNPHGIQLEWVTEDGIDFTFMGADPQVLVNYVRIDHSNCATFNFVVPNGGYAHPVIRQYPDPADMRDPNQKQVFSQYRDDNSVLPILIDRASPALNGGSAKVKLVDWPMTISPDTVDIEQPNVRVRSGTLFSWTYGDDDADAPAQDGDKPTGLWVEIKRPGFAVSIR